MKIKIIKQIEYNFDYDAEVKSIKRIFSSEDEQKFIAPLLAVLDAFWIENNLEKTMDLYDNLPYNDVREYPLQESVNWMYKMERAFEVESRKEYHFLD